MFSHVDPISWDSERCLQCALLRRHPALEVKQEGDGKLRGCGEKRVPKSLGLQSHAWPSAPTSSSMTAVNAAEKEHGSHISHGLLFPVDSP